MAPKTMSELLDEINKQIGVEETLQGKNIFGLSALLPSKRHGDWNSLHDQERGVKKNKDKANTSEDKPKPQFTPLTVPLGEVYA